MSRISSALCLLVALLLGMAPLRICAHADSDHGRVRIVASGCHDHSAGGPSRTSRTTLAQAARRVEHIATHHCGPGCSKASACAPTRHLHLGHTPELPAGDGGPAHENSGQDDHCHCSDAPLVVVQPLAPVTLAAPVSTPAPRDLQHVPVTRSVGLNASATLAEMPQQRAALESTVLIR